MARKYAPDDLAWNSTVTSRDANSQAAQFEDFDQSTARGFLMPGTNVLAVQGLNVASTNNDFFLQAELTAVNAGWTGTEYRYFLAPTPGAVNQSGAADLGPLFLGMGHTPAVLQPNDPLVVTASVAQAFNSISNVTLTYRVMFNSEIQRPMNDDEIDGDAVAGDGIWTTTIPGAVAAPGQMIRYQVTASDSQNQLSRWPLFSNPTDSEAYWGTIVADTNIQSHLPVVYLFIQYTSALDSGSAARGSLFFLGELYDNVRFDLHGQSSAGWPKKGYNIDFNRDHRFLYSPGAPREKDITLMSPYGDKTRLHTLLTYAEVAAAGGVGHFAYQVRVQRNAAFYGIESMVENGDDLFLARLGRDPNGALYKMYNDMSSAGGNEKKTRTPEDFSDLQALIGNLAESRPLTNRVQNAFDNLDLPQTISYFATMALVSSQDHGHKNYYLFRDSDGTGEWTIFPWDVDLSWGRKWLDSLGHFSDILYQTNTLTFYNPAQQSKPSNRLYDLIFNNPDFRRMYLRRLRTLMDTVLMAPGTCPEHLPIEAQIRKLKDLMPPRAHQYRRRSGSRPMGPALGQRDLRRPARRSGTDDQRAPARSA